MKHEEFIETEACHETTMHAMHHLITGDMDATPPNSHVAIALIANVQVVGLASEVLFSLSDYLQRNPAVGELLWDECLREVVEKTN